MGSNAGEAKIKEQFLLPKLCVKKEGEEKDGSIIDVTKCVENIEEPPAKKLKKKGQNKARGRTVPKVKDRFRLCPTILNNNICSYGAECKFSHQIETYLENKPADIGAMCVNYIVSGRCRYGVECRYGSQHLLVDGTNLIDEEKYEEYLKAHTKSENKLTKTVMLEMRRKKYCFDRTDEFFSSDDGPLTPREKKRIDFNDKLYLAPLTTVGNLPFRRICKGYGADITCGEMAMSANLLQGRQAEWALVKRHPCEDTFGVQLCGGHPELMSKAAELLNKECNVDFIDINVGCPIDLVFKKGEGSALMGRTSKLRKVVQSMVQVSDVPITIKMRTGIHENNFIAHKIIPLIKEWGVDLITLHGRTREQRYTKIADWNYINKCSQLSQPVPLFGNGDVLSYEDAMLRREATGVSGLMIARGALIKPWIFTEIKEQRHWDISSQERFDILKDFTNYGLEHWGSDTKGVENTRRFLLEWLSFLHRYIPVGLLEVVPQKINERPPSFFGRNHLETMFASRNSVDWVKISEMLLGPVPDNFEFVPKHKANSYS